MGRGDDPEFVTQTTLDEDETMVRQALARWGEPSAVPLPPALAARVQAAVREGRPIAVTAPRRWLFWRWFALIVLLPCTLLGAWGVFVDSTAPAALLGDPMSGVAQWLLMLTLAAKPFLNALLLVGPILIVGVGGVAAAAWLWWYAVRTSAGKVRG
jgi:hypothetical protein